MHEFKEETGVVTKWTMTKNSLSTHGLKGYSHNVTMAIAGNEKDGVRIES